MKIFVYGTLKRGFSNHRLLENSTYIGPAETMPVYRLFDNGFYPCMIEDEEGVSVVGEIYDVSDGVRKDLDRLEGTDSGLYKRVRIQLKSIDEPVEGYVYLRSVEGLKECGNSWSPRSPERDRASRP